MMRPCVRRKRPAAATTELAALEARLLSAKGLTEVFPEIIERAPAMAKYRDPTNGYPDIKVVEAAGLK